MTKNDKYVTTFHFHGNPLLHKSRFLKVCLVVLAMMLGSTHRTSHTCLLGHGILMLPGDTNASEAKGVLALRNVHWLTKCPEADCSFGDICQFVTTVITQMSQHIY